MITLWLVILFCSWPKFIFFFFFFSFSFLFLFFFFFFLTFLFFFFFFFCLFSDVFQKQNLCAGNEVCNWDPKRNSEKCFQEKEKCMYCFSDYSCVTIPASSKVLSLFLFFLIVRE